MAANSMPILLVCGLIVGAFLSTATVQSFKQPACCMRGLKAMQNVIMCDAPCCIGHHEQMAEVTHLGLLVWCEEEQQQQKDDSSPSEEDFGFRNPLNFDLRKKRHILFGGRRS